MSACLNKVVQENIKLAIVIATFIGSVIGWGISHFISVGESREKQNNLTIAVEDLKQKTEEIDKKIGDINVTLGSLRTSNDLILKSLNIRVEPKGVAINTAEVKDEKESN